MPILMFSCKVESPNKDDSVSSSNTQLDDAFTNNELNLSINQTNSNQSTSSNSNYVEYNQCYEISSNLVGNGDFSDPTIQKNWEILNNQDDASLIWDVSWKSKKPCGANMVEPRLELQKKNGDQILELDSDCQGNNQFSLNFPVKKEKTKISVQQNVDLILGQTYKLSFRVRKRSNNVKEHLKVHVGKQSFMFRNESLSTNWEDKVLYFKAKYRNFVNGESVLKFNPIGGKSDSFGLYLDKVDLKAVANCPIPKQMCETVHKVVNYSPMGNIPTNRMDTANVLGLPDGEPYNPSDVNFVSLGFGGSIIVQFKPAIVNKPGSDLRVYETSGGNLTYSQYPEIADVYGSNNLMNWKYLGEIKNENDNPQFGEVDLGTMNRAKYIKIVDKTTQVGGDGFDVDAMMCLGQDQASYWKSRVFYADKTFSKIYSTHVNKKVKLKERLDFNTQNGASHIALSADKRYVYEVENNGTNKIYQHDVNKKTSQMVGELNLNKVTMVGMSSSGLLYVGDMSSDKIYRYNLVTQQLDDLGYVYLNNKKVDLSGGDLALTDQKMYIATQSKGGVLYEVDFDTNGVLQAEEVVSNLGKVSGLAVLDYNHFLMSVLNKDYMLEYKNNQLNQKILKGDLLNQGSGADLASNPPIEEMSQF